jgi:hypothetical protein
MAAWKLSGHKAIPADPKIKVNSVKFGEKNTNPKVLVSVCYS